MNLEALLHRTIHARRIERELNSFDDKTLAELGIYRADIPAIAAEDARRKAAES